MRRSNSNFGRRGVFNCAVCERSTRETVQSESRLCPECWELAGLDNVVNDNGLKYLDANMIAQRDALLAKAVKRGSNGDKIKESNSYLWPAEMA